MTPKLVIFGTGEIAQLAHYYFSTREDVRLWLSR